MTTTPRILDTAAVAALAGVTAATSSTACKASPTRPTSRPNKRHYAPTGEDTTVKTTTAPTSEKSLDVTITQTEMQRVRDALLSPRLRLVAGLGTATTPGEGDACTIAEINLALTGRLDDGAHPCMSEAIRRWVIGVQDAMPQDVRDSAAWRGAAVGIAGSADPAREPARAALTMGWMWERLGDDAVRTAVPAAAVPAWDRMLSERTFAATAAAAADAAAAAAAAAAAWAATAAAADAAWAATAAAAAATADAAAAWAATDAAADAAWADAYWRRADPAAMLWRLVAAHPTQR